MSQREVLIMMAHALGCMSCRDRLLEEPDKVFRGRSLTGEEKEALAKLTSADFITTELLSRKINIPADQIREYRDHPVARLRHF
jgi:hypothetical protein